MVDQTVDLSVAWTVASLVDLLVASTVGRWEFQMVDSSAGKLAASMVMMTVDEKADLTADRMVV